MSDRSVLTMALGPRFNAENTVQPEIDVHGIALAEAVGFEPTVGYTPTAVFKTAALNLSATLPEINLASLLNLVLLLARAIDV